MNFKRKISKFFDNYRLWQLEERVSDTNADILDRLTALGERLEHRPGVPPMVPTPMMMHTPNIRKFSEAWDLVFGSTENGTLLILNHLMYEEPNDKSVDDWTIVMVTDDVVRGVSRADSWKHHWGKTVKAVDGIAEHLQEGGRLPPRTLVYIGKLMHDAVEVLKRDRKGWGK